GQHVLGDETGVEVAVFGPEWVAAPGGLEREEAAARGRDAQGAAAVVAVRHWHHARRDGRGGATARATGRSVAIPGIVRWPEETGLGRRGVAEFGCVRLTEDD